MNILVIGNGFDLVHELPTKYTDFLEFCKRVFPIYENAEGRGIHLYQQEYLFEWDFNKEIKEGLKSAYDSRGKIIIDGNIAQIETTYPRLDEMYALIKDNNWIEYFLQCDMYGKENWIDFEDEISEAIQSINKGIDESDSKSIYNNILCLENKFFNDKFTNNVPKYSQVNTVEEQEKVRKPEISYKELRDILLADLNKLIRALEIYMCEYVEKIEINEKSPDIDKSEIDFILSFNYTHIFSKLYHVSSQSKQEVSDPFDYIHGEADINNTVETNNMVLGIDEYLSKKRRNKEIDFIAFKKYYQRIYKQTGSEYKRWVEIIRNRMQGIDDKIKKQYPVQIPYNEIPNKCRNQLFIFGHSLDITDKDVLRELILNDNVYTTIFYPDKKELGRKIANLVKVIGQDELIRRTGGSTKMIEFKLQQPMVPIENQ